MQTLLVWTILFFGVTAIVRRWQRADRPSKTPSFAEVDADQAKAEPYPYVHVNDDGSARELDRRERKYLETPFSPFDGGRPYVKESHSQKNGWGQLRGFMQRSRLPAGIQLHPAPKDDPSRPSST